LGFNIESSSELSASLPGASGSTDIDQETGVFVSGQFGRRLNDTFSIDGELLYVSHDLDTDEVAAALATQVEAETKAFGLMVNVQAQFLPDAQVHPYVGAGVGYGQTKVKLRVGADQADDDDAGVMWQLKAGLTGPLSENVSFDAGYRYLSLPEYEASDSGASLKLETPMHVLSFGMRYGF